MGRPVVLSNGQLFIGLNEHGLVHDFYYPYVGLENLTNARNSQHKIGIWVEDRFLWIDDGSWDISVDFDPKALISKVQMKSRQLGITVNTRDFIDPSCNAFIRQLNIVNDSDREREVRLFMHQVFQISRAGRADTALYVPDDHYILDYKGHCCLLIAGRISGDGDFDQYAVGNFGIEGKAGTFKDAEDGELSGNSVEHGGVDSVIRFSKTLDPGGSTDIDYWIVAADSQTDAQIIHTKIKYYSVNDRANKTAEHWRDWLLKSNEKLEAIPEQLKPLIQKSLLVIKAHCDARGSILASGDSSIFNYGRDYYCYCWPRDAAYAIWPLIRAGIYDEAKNFFEFASSTMHPDGYLMHKYQPDRAIGSTWHPLIHSLQKELAIQEDETAIVLHMLGEYYRATKDIGFIERMYLNFIEPSTEFIYGFIDQSTGLPHASYDLWEQKFLTTTYTVSSVIAALNSASMLADVCRHPDDSLRWKSMAERIRGNLDKLYHPDGYFRKGYLLDTDGSLEFDDTVDISSLYGPYMFGHLPLNDHRLSSTLSIIEKKLLNTSPSGGVIRFTDDKYFLEKQQYPGNPWIVCTLWLAQYYNAKGRRDEAIELINWAAKHTSKSGVLSEQYDPENGSSLGVTPLVWSHAEFINTVFDVYGVK